MQSWVALFRGINVGGHRKLPMKELAAELEALGLREVRTYIQSGNVVFRCEEHDGRALADRIAASVEANHGFAPRVMVLTVDEVRAAAQANPFKAGEDTPKLLHLYFLDEAPPSPDIDTMQRIKQETDAFRLEGKILYLHTPDGYGTSQLAERLERLLGVAATARNWRTVTKILELADSL